MYLGFFLGNLRRFRVAKKRNDVMTNIKVDKEQNCNFHVLINVTAPALMILLLFFFYIL